MKPKKIRFFHGNVTQHNVNYFDDKHRYYSHIYALDTKIIKQHL